MSIPRLVAVGVFLCAFGTAWSWIDRGSEGSERWQMRLLFLAIGLLILLPILGYHTIGKEHHYTKAQEEAASEVEAP